jgi:FHS family Na+ dependent glucose MFS transporter 1
MNSSNGIGKNKEINYFITYGISCISLGLASAAIGLLLPSLAAFTRVSLAQISFLFTAHSLGYLLGSSGGGRLYDHLKGHTLMKISVGLMMLTSLFIPITSSFFLLLISMFFLGLGQGGLDVGANVNLMWVYQSRVGPYMNGLHFFFGLGAFLSPILVYNIMRLSGGTLTWPFWVLALLYLPGLIGLFFLKSPKNPEKEEKEQSGKSVNAWLVTLMVLLFFIYVGVEIGFGGWIYTYAIEVKAVNETNAAYINSIFWGALTVGRFLSVFLSRKLPPGKILIGNFLLSAISLGVILIWPTRSAAVWIGSAGLGFAISSVFPMLLVLGETRMKITGGVTGLFFLGSSVGGMIVPMVLGQIFEFVGTYQVMLTLFVMLIAGFFVLLSVLAASNRAGEKVRV